MRTALAGSFAWLALAALADLCGQTAAPILTPPPSPAPRINGPRVYGARPGRPFLYRIPCTGRRPIRFSADGLPQSITLDPETGILRGRAPDKRGEYLVTLRAANSLGASQRRFKIVVGDTIALTPPMGWNHWYTHYNRITDALMREAADVLVASGMADHGYQYVNIDDCWMVKPGDPNPEIGGPPREPDGTIRPNRRFPDMAGLAEYIHAKGLKFGIYTSPGPRTCAGFEGAYGHEEQDARTFARWGVDFLKYDWCSYGKIAPGTDLASRQAPYRLMGGILARLDRDIHLNLCQYGMSEVWKWGRQVGGHSWRTTGDLGLEKGDRLPGFYRIGLRNARLWEYAQPGGWNDPDYILIGWVGNAHRIEDPPRYTSLTPDEQYSYMSMWSLMAAPLFYSGLMSKLDAFTLNVLCNAEVIDINQDSLGRQARILRESDEELVLAKPLEDGSLAAGLFNLGEQERTIALSWSELGLKGRQRVRDLWRQRELGIFPRRFAVPVARHGVVLVRLWPAG
jgi:alpha-galactosidase